MVPSLDRLVRADERAPCVGTDVRRDAGGDLGDLGDLFAGMGVGMPGSKRPLAHDVEDDAVALHMEHIGGEPHSPHGPRTPATEDELSLVRESVDLLYGAKQDLVVFLMNMQELRGERAVDYRRELRRLAVEKVVFEQILETYALYCSRCPPGRRPSFSDKVWWLLDVDDRAHDVHDRCRALVPTIAEFVRKEVKHRATRAQTTAPSSAAGSSASSDAHGSAASAHAPNSDAVMNKWTAKKETRTPASYVVAAVRSLFQFTTLCDTNGKTSILVPNQHYDLDLRGIQIRTWRKLYVANQVDPSRKPAWSWAVFLPEQHSQNSYRDNISDPRRISVHMQRAEDRLTKRVVPYPLQASLVRCPHTLVFHGKRFLGYYHYVGGTAGVVDTGDGTESPPQAILARVLWSEDDALRAAVAASNVALRPV